MQNIVALPYVAHGLYRSAWGSTIRFCQRWLCQYGGIPFVRLIFLHLLHGLKETVGKEQRDIEKKQGGLGKHVCSPHHIFVNVFTFPSWHNNRVPDRREERQP